MVSEPKLIKRMPKWFLLIILADIILVAVFLLYFIYPPFREWWGRYLPQDIDFVIFLFLFIFVILLVIAGLMSGARKKRKLLAENMQRLGMQFEKKVILIK